MGRGRACRTGAAAWRAVTSLRLPQAFESLGEQVVVPVIGIVSLVAGAAGLRRLVVGPLVVVGAFGSAAAVAVDTVVRFALAAALGVALPLTLGVDTAFAEVALPASSASGAFAFAEAFGSATALGVGSALGFGAAFALAVAFGFAVALGLAVAFCLGAGVGSAAALAFGSRFGFGARVPFA